MDVANSRVYREVAQSRIQSEQNIAFREHSKRNSAYLIGHTSSAALLRNRGLQVGPKRSLKSSHRAGPLRTHASAGNHPAAGGGDGAGRAGNFAMAEDGFFGSQAYT